MLYSSGMHTPAIFLAILLLVFIGIGFSQKNKIYIIAGITILLLAGGGLFLLSI